MSEISQLIDQIAHELRRYVELSGDVLDINTFPLRKKDCENFVTLCTAFGYIDAIDPKCGTYRINVQKLPHPCLH